ncbi:hypothetical protein L1765_04960 [Microaerobacter geothermalis]|uniref:ComEC/Rec2 family competence protein n=1 Tax=Microaerobacter geothermalis TaxID=674972 RepID=UPI001F1D8408|nr:hypothetical protein [Microaerobacter geothermalis]MCF6093346.1 hypothetical protein [Microaerobacter geothermalis]
MKKIIFGNILILVIFLLAGRGNIDSHLPTVSAVKENQEQIPFGEMKVTFLDVGRGEATLVQMDDGFTMLIDTGTKGYENQLIEELIRNRVSEIDILIATNDSEEYTGNIVVLLKKWPIKKIMYAELFKKDIMGKIGFTPEIEKKALFAEDIINIANNVKIKILSPDEPYSNNPQGNSLVFQLIHGEVSILFTSGIDEDTEKKLVEKYDLKSSILKVSDMGSIQSSTPEFLQEVDAFMAVVFPAVETFERNEEVLERLNESWMDVYQISRDGSVSIISDGKDYIVEKKENSN